MHADLETINFDPDTPIREVAAHDGKYWTAQIIFMENAGKEFYAYNPSNATQKTTAYRLGENEELIGVYGLKDKSSYFSSFGFIVKNH